MKKILAILLTITMCIPLVACGGAQTKEIGLNETITVGDYEFTLAETEFVDQYYVGGVYKFCGEGNVHFVVETTFKNIGKEEISVPYTFLELEYGDGYTFSPESTYCYSFDTNSFVANASTLAVLADAKPCQTYFEVPEAVQNNEEEPLKLKITVSGTEYIYNVR